MITGVRFYKASLNTGVHVGSLWSATGSRLASATFGSETASGWQEVTFATPVAVTANTVYVASYHAPNGRYAVNGAAFATTSVVNGPLEALASGVMGGNGVFRYGVSQFPTDSFNSANYWVDVVFVNTTPPDTTAPELLSTAPPEGATNVALDGVISATFSEDLSAASVNASSMELIDPDGNRISATVGYLTSSRTATLQPAAPLLPSTSYAVTVHGGAAGIRDASGNPLVGMHRWSFVTTDVSGPPATCPCSIWLPSQVPTVATASDPGAVELGLKFRASVDGYVAGVRFFKGPQNTGTHIGSLWTSGGVLLASVTFTGETPTGWQQATFATPVAVVANTVYVVSYHAPNGRYAVDAAYLSSGAVNGPLTALANGVAGGNGLFRYGTTGFPTESFNSANYWVDVVFDTTVGPDGNPPDIASVTPPANSGYISINTSVSAIFTADMNVSSISATTFELRDATGNLVPASVSYLAAARTATLQPINPLTPSMTYSATVRGASQGVRDVAGATMATDYAWVFTTGSSSVTLLTDTSVAHFLAGSGTGIYVGAVGDGEFLLQPFLGLEFSEPELPAGWTTTTWGSGGSASIVQGALIVDGAMTLTDEIYGPGRSLEFVATFGSASSRHAGFALTLNESLWAMFST